MAQLNRRLQIQYQKVLLLALARIRKKSTKRKHKLIQCMLANMQKNTINAILIKEVILHGRRHNKLPLFWKYLTHSRSKFQM